MVFGPVRPEGQVVVLALTAGASEKFLRGKVDVLDDVSVDIVI